MRKHLKIKIVDFWSTLNPKDNIIFEYLTSKYELEFCDDPDYLFFSIFGSEHLKYSCIKVFFTGENLCPDFNLCDYAIGFDYLNFGDRYLRLPLFYQPEYAHDYELMIQKHKIKSDILDQKEGFCSFVYSNTKASPVREEVFKRLSEYKQVASGGRFLNNVGGPVENKNEFQKKYKFSIAFENSSHKGYLTEKIVQAYAALTIPIYWGDPSAKELFNPDSFIDATAFDDMDTLIEWVKYIDDHDEVYLKMMQTPALNPNAPTKEQVLKEIYDFLDNIFEQPYRKAFRYNRTFWRQNYTENLQRLYANNNTVFAKLKRKLDRVFKYMKWICGYCKYHH